MDHAHSRLYRDGVLEVENFPLEDVSRYLAQEGTIVWVDFCAPSQDELHQLAAELGLHELAVEDAVGEHQRPKLDHYDSHLFLSCHATRIEPDRPSSSRPRSTRSSTSAGWSPCARTTPSR